MARVAQDSFDDDDDNDPSAPADREDPDPSDQDPDEADDGTISCPYCRKPVYEGAEICPHCKSFISQEDAPRPGVPWWFWVGVVLCLVAALLWSL